MTLRFASLILSLGLSLSGSALAQSTSEVKSESLKYLQDLRNENSKRLQDVNESLRKKIEEGNPVDLTKDVSNLKATQRELSLRQDFLSRLITSIDAHFNGGSLRAFLEPQLKEMAKVDAVSSDSGLYLFMRYAADAVQKLPEQKENVLSFLEGYMKISISNPITPKEFLAKRNYSNGTVSEAGSPMDRDKVGAVADRRIQELHADASNPPAAPAAPPAD